jgi:hypothetical protein
MKHNQVLDQLRDYQFSRRMSRIEPGFTEITLRAVLLRESFLACLK